jgi:adenylosuccinate synthase
MPVIVVVGMQWGDEAKGKFVDLLAQDAQVVARFNGGDNAGHTVVNPYGTFKLRLTPNGFANPLTNCVIGAGVVVNLATLLDEVEMIQNRGIDLAGRLFISPRCQVIMPYHPLLESIFEEAKGQGRTGTTRRGIGPVYADKASYNGISLSDLGDERQFAEKVRIQLAIKNPILRAFGVAPLDFQSVYQEKLEQYARLRQWVREPFGLLHAALTNGSKIVLEGAQGAFLDNTWGTYPFCTASNTLSGGALSGLGLPPQALTSAGSAVIGVAKAYTTRVGAGPFPTELSDATGEILQKQGQEYGTVTGRARRCGWFDAGLVRFSAQVNGCTALALTKLDVLDSLPELKIGLGYRSVRGEAGEKPGLPPIAQYWEGDAAWLEGCRPVYETWGGWQTPTREVREFDRLPEKARLYIQRIEELVGVPVKYVSVGPGRDETIDRS